MSSPEKEMFSVGEASERTGLPESTIRYYDREFSDYLQIPRGNNNQRLFDDGHLQDLEYIRYLIKREELSIEEVRERLKREQDYRPDSDATEEVASDAEASSTTRPESEASAGPSPGVKKLAEQLNRIEDRLDALEERQQTIKKLLDLNLQRYNQLVDDL
jgi:DNA-binding transcriptional MerR regulator